MLTTAPNTSADLAANLLAHYSFDLNGHSTSELIERWRVDYPIDWLHLAVIEALYLGRYKAISVQQLLNFWQRRGQVIYHFNMEFERLICSRFPETLTATAAPVLSPGQKHSTIEQLTNSHLSPAKVENSYRQSKTTPQQPASGKEEGRWRSRDEGSVLTSPSFKVVTEPAPRQLAAAVSQKVVFPASLPDKERLPIRTQLPEKLPAKANNPPIEQFIPHHSDGLRPTGGDSVAHKLLEPLPATANNPPIGQFTPQMSDRAESFTSKLKAMSVESAE